MAIRHRSKVADWLMYYTGTSSNFAALPHGPITVAPAQLLPTLPDYPVKIYGQLKVQWPRSGFKLMA